MNTIEIYSVEENCINIESLNNQSLNNQSYLLDLSKDPSKYDSIEYFIYTSVKGHNNISINKELFVEFKYTNNNTKVETYYNNALLTCITYLTDKGGPTYITNIDLECYKYKEFENQTDLYISLPTKNKQIAFNGKYFHKTFNSDIITIYLWDVKPTNVEYYTTDIKESTSYNSTNIYMYNQDTIRSVNVCKKLINYELFNELLYNNNPKVIERFTTFMTPGIDSYKFIVDTQIEQQKLTNELKIKYGNIIDDFNEIMKPEFNIKYNRFLQRFQYPKIYTPEMCSFIIGECEKYAHNNGGWTMKRHIKYPTTDLPVEKIPSIFGLVLETLKPIITNIKNSYGLHDEMNLQISDLFVVKYKEDSQNYLEMHCDESLLSFNILLSDKTDFEGGGTYFDDGLIVKLEQGSVVVHSSKIKHAGLPITKGTRYILVGFVNIVTLV
jgi:hypothetical protein